MAEAVKVIVRCRPLNKREKDLKCGVVVQMDEKTGQVGLCKPGAEGQGEPPKSFTFDGAFFVNSITETIYENIAFPLVEGVMEGYNGTVFAYGQTGCGKSFSMTGIEDPPTQRGIIPRAFKHIFEAVASNSDAKFLIRGSYLEIYNEEIRDLLGKDAKAKLDLKEHPDKGVYVKDLTMMAVQSVAEIEHVMALGGKNRSVGATLMNADSSRSHSIFTISLERCDTVEGQEGSGLRAGKLNLVDLAGSERQGKTGATGDRLKEATKINLSLSALGNVISALVDGKAKHIPYRDSKLTRLLQDSLGGNTKTLMVACVSPADNNYDETLSTLRYANRAKNIKNKPKINEDPKDALLREYSDEIARLKALLTGQGIPQALGSAQPVPVGDDPYAKLREAEEEKEKAKQEMEEFKRQYQKQVEEIQANFEAARESKEDLERSLASLQKDYIGKEDHAKRKLVRAESQIEQLSPRQASQGGMQLAPHGDADPSVSQHTSKAPVGIITTPMEAVAAAAAAGTAPGPDEGAQAARHRLQELQDQLVGGERAHDKDLKKKLQTRRRHADTVKETLMKNLEEDGDLEVMGKIYDNMQDKLRGKAKALDKTTQKLRVTEAEVRDLQEEFERDRADYLDSIREQEKQIAWFSQVLNIVAPCLRRDCNYFNIDWVKSSSTWSEESQKWKLPKIELVKTSLPNAMGPGSTVARHPLTGSSNHASGRSPMLGGSQRGGVSAVRAEDSPRLARNASPALQSNHGLADGNGQVHASMYDENPDESSKLRDRLERCQESDYFKPKRQDQLLAEAHAIQRSHAQKTASARQPSMLPPSQLLPGTSIPPPGHQLQPLHSSLPKLGGGPGADGSPQSMGNEGSGGYARSRHGTLEPLNDRRFRR